MRTKDDVALRIEHLLVDGPDNMSNGLKDQLRKMPIEALSELEMHVRERLDETAHRWISRFGGRGDE